MRKTLKNLLGNIFKQDANTLSSLKRLVRSSDTNEIQLILNQAYGLVNQLDENSQTILDYALAKGSDEVISVLVENKARVSLSFYNLHEEEDFLQLLTKLDRAGFDLNNLDTLGFAPIHYASMHGFSNAVKFLVDKNVDIQAVDVNGRSAISISLSGQSIDLQVRGNS